MLAVLLVSATALVLLAKNMFLPGQGAFSEPEDPAEARAVEPFVASVRQGSEGSSAGLAGWQNSTPGSTARLSTTAAGAAGSGTARAALRNDPGYPPPEDVQTDPLDNPYDSLEDGLLEIAGMVVNEAGEPVGSTWVVAITRRLYVEQAEFLDLVESGRERRTGTDARGHFRFQGLADGDYEIRTVSSDLYPLVAIDTVRAGVDSVRLLVVEEREVWVNGYVASTEGQVLPQVEIFSNLSAEPVAFSDGSGSFGFPLTVRGDRGHAITFRSEGYQDQRFVLTRSDWGEWDQVDLEVAMWPTEVLTAVSGTVQSKSGDPVAGEQIYLKRMQQKYKSTTNAAGGFVFEGVESGANYVLWLMPQGPYRPYRQEQLSVPADGVSGLAILLDPVSTASVAGWMTDTEGNPVSNFTLLARSYDSRGSAVQVTSDRDGYFRVYDIPDGRLRLESGSFPRFVVSGIQLAAGSDIEIDLVLDVGNEQLGGWVIDEQGNPVAGADITLSWLLRDNGLLHESLRKTTTNADGSFQFTQLGPRTHSLIVRAPGFEVAQVAADPDLGSGFGNAGGGIEVQLNRMTQ